MAYVPNASDATQPTEDKSVESAALEFRTMKVDLVRSLKFPLGESAIYQGPLPAAASRAGRFLAFDSVTGQPAVGPLITDWTITQAQITSISTVAANMTAILAVNSQAAAAAASASTAAGHASAASVSATAAASSATAAANSAIAADASFNDAALASGAASDSALLAFGYKNAAATSATNANTAATSAQSFATAAQGYASSAQSYSNLANTYASNASASATAAAASATAASGSATTASSAASTATTGAATSTTNAQLAEDWATKLVDTVDGSDYSAKYYAEQSQFYASESGSSAQYALAVLAAAEAAEIVCHIDGGGLLIGSGTQCTIEIPFACTITSWTLLATSSGSSVVDLQKATFAGYPTTASITGSTPPTISSSTKGQSSTLTGWTPALDAGDLLSFVVTGATVNHTKVTVSLKVVKTI